MNTTVKNLFDEAQKKLNQANQELFRPEEDVVHYLVCQNSHVAIENYLRGYLLLNNKNTRDLLTIDDLYRECKLINKNFEEVDLSGFNCNSHEVDSRFRNASSGMSHCFELADSLDTFLRKEKLLL